MKTLAIIITTAAGLALPGTVPLRAQDSVAAAALAQAQEAVQAAQAEADKAQADTTRALENARAQVEESHQRLTQRTAGAAPVPPPAAEFSTRLQNIITRASVGGGPTKPLVIQSSNPDPKEQASLEEDLAVMAHILDKALEDVPGTQWHGGGGPQAMGINVLLEQGSGPVRNLYLDGYGALFFVSVNFPLIAPAAKSDDEKPAGDSTWEEAKQELYGGGPGVRAPFPPAEEFSPEKVNKLKTTLLDALKNASNIRGVKPEESITVCVLGGPRPAGPRPKHVARADAGGGGGGAGYGGGFGFAYSGTPSQGTIMTIRVRKSDVDSFAKGKVSPEEFQKRARITTYATSADSGNSELGWVGGGGSGGIWAGGSSGSTGGGGGNTWFGGSTGSAGGGGVR